MFKWTELIYLKCCCFQNEKEETRKQRKVKIKKEKTHKEKKIQNEKEKSTCLGDRLWCTFFRKKLWSFIHVYKTLIFPSVGSSRPTNFSFLFSFSLFWDRCVKWSMDPLVRRELLSVLKKYTRWTQVTHL